MNSSRSILNYFILFLIVAMGMLLIVTGVRVFVIAIYLGEGYFDWTPTFFCGLLNLVSCYILLKSQRFILRLAVLIYLMLQFVQVGMIIFWFDIRGLDERLRLFFSLLIFSSNVLFIIQFIKECQQQRLHAKTTSIGLHCIRTKGTCTQRRNHTR